MRRLILILAAVVGVLAAAPAAYGWPAPVVEGDCDGWYVTETAPDHDWKDTSYWTIDGVDGQHERGATVFVADDSDATERTFKVRWFNEKGKQLDAREGTGVRDLSECEEPPIDVCPNLEGVQETVPDGMIVDEQGNCVEEPPPPVNIVVDIDTVCDVGAVVSWTGGPLEHRSIAILGPDGFFVQQEMSSVSSVTIPFGGPYDFAILNTGGDEFVEDELTELDGSYPEPVVCQETPPTTVPPTTPPTEPPVDTTQPPAPPTTEGPAPTTPVQQGDSEQGPQGSFPVPPLAIALVALVSVAGVTKLAITKIKG
jgi:hypothetical protein